MFFKKNKKEDEDKNFVKIASLLIHAAKIDENFSKTEEKIITEALLKLGAKNESLESIIKAGKLMEENANQILDFTREVKNMDENKKIQIIETLWQIIYSNKEACLLYTSPSPRDKRQSRMPSSA